MGEGLRILVVGCGSIGRRHISNLRSLFAEEIIACDRSSEQLDVIRQQYGIERTYTDLREAMGEGVDAVLVCTPPSTHISVAAEAVRYGAHVFIEKPMSNSLDGTEELLEAARDNGLIICVGYNFRFHRGLRQVKEMVDDGVLGRVLSARAEFGQYLPDWRPWQDYTQSYTARKDLGGGIILDGSHEIDYLRWLIGDIEQVWCFSDKVSSLEVETEDIAEITFRFRNGAIGQVHLDFVRPGYTRTCEIIGEDGIIRWNYQDKFVETYLKEVRRWERFDIEGDDNDMYVEEMRHFIECVKTGREPLVDGQEGLKSLKVTLLAKQSVDTMERVRV